MYAVPEHDSSFLACATPYRRACSHYYVRASSAQIRDPAINLLRGDGLALDLFGRILRDRFSPLERRASALDGAWISPLA